MIRVTAPAALDALEIAQALLPDQLLKAEYVRDSKTWHPDRTMRELHQHAVRAYEAVYKRMVQAIKAWVEQHVVHSALEKADRPFSSGDFVLVSPEQLAQIKKIIGDYHEAYVAGMIDPRLLPPGDLQRLMDAGILPEDLAFVLQPRPGELPPTAQRMITAAYQYGKSLGTVPPTAQPKLRDQSFEVFLTGPALPLTRAEREALTFNEEHAAEYVRGLSRRVQAALTTRVANTVSTLTHEDVTEAVDAAIRKRAAWRTIVTDLGDRSGDWSRDLGRIAATEKQRAMQEGQTRAMIRAHGDPEDIQVAKIPQSTACFLAGTQILTRSGFRSIETVCVGDEVLTHKLRWRKVTTVFERQFEGILFGINGVLPYATGEHPFLADLRWQRADSLQCGQQVIKLAALVNADQDPTVSADNRGLTRVSFSDRATAVMPVSAVQLYCDLQCRDSNVDIEYTSSQLENNLVALPLQARAELEGIRSSVPLAELLRNGLSSLGSGQVGAFSCTQSTCDDPFTDSQGPRLRFFDTDLSVVLENVPEATQVFSDSRARGTEIGSNRFESGSGTFVSLDQFFSVETFGRVRHRAVVAARTQEIESIASAQFEGRVFNLEVEEDHSYFANDLAVHNCNHCVRLHLTAGPGSPPRIFRLSELIDNGSNVGKKARDWQATVPPVHPWCACVLVRVPPGWGFDEYGNMTPESLTRSELLSRNLRKAEWYEKPGNLSGSAPDQGVAIRVADPTMRMIVEAVVAATPPAIFQRGRGITLITTDTERETTPLKTNDLAYWNGNEIRLMQTLSAKRVKRVLEHEIGHSLNVWLWERFGRDLDKVHAWHRELWEVSQREGFVSNYAKREPIENAAEASRLYLYERVFLRENFPRTFALLHSAYADALV